MKVEEGTLELLEFRTGTQTLVAKFREVIRDLEGFLQLMIETDGRWVLLLETELNASHYVQLLTDRDDEILLAECVSNEFLRGSDRLKKEQEEFLPTIGWDWPAPPNELNWRTIEFKPSSALETAIRIGHTLRRVFECSDETVVKILFFDGAGGRLTPNDLADKKPQLEEPSDLSGQSNMDNLASFLEELI